MSSPQPLPSQGQSQAVARKGRNFTQVANRFAVLAALVAVALAVITIMCLVKAARFNISIPVFNMVVTVVVLLALPKYAGWIFRRVATEVVDDLKNQMLTDTIALGREICHESEVRQRNSIKQMIAGVAKHEAEKLQKQIADALAAAHRSGMVRGAEQMPAVKPTNGSHLQSVQSPRS